MRDIIPAWLRAPRTTTWLVLAALLLVAIAIGFIAVIAIRTGFNLYIDIAIALGLVGFLATVAFARFVERQGMQPGEDAPKAEPAARRGRRAKGRRTH